MRQAIAAAVGAIALGCVGSGPAAAADIPLPPAQQAPAPEYYGPAVEEGPVYGPPPAYAYPAAPPVYYYGPPAVVVAPGPYSGPYYRRPYARYVYGRPVYAARGYAPYGRYRYRGHHRW